jgi:hypothetical protein
MTNARRRRASLPPWRFPPSEPAAILASAADRNIGDGIHHVRVGPVGEEHVPAALLWRLLAGAGGNHGLPVGGLHVDLEAGVAQELRRDDRLRLQRQDIAGRQYHDECAVIAGFGEQLFRFRHAIALHQRFQANIGSKRRALSRTHRNLDL